MSETQRGNGGKFAKRVAEVKEDIQEVIEDVLGSVKENVKDVIEDVKDSVKENARDVIEGDGSLKENARDVIEDLKASVKESAKDISEDTVKAIKSKLKHSEEYQIEGTGKSRHLAKGAKYFVGGELAEVLINAGKAKLAK
jgi:ssDNA-specific exonuclease RecJ